MYILKNIIYILSLLTSFTMLSLFLSQEFSFRRIELLLILSTNIILMSNLFLTKKKFFFNLFSLSLISYLFFIIQILSNEDLFFENIVKYICFYTSIINIFIIFISFINFKLSFIFIFLLLFILFIPISLACLYYLTSHSLLSVDTLIAITQTNFIEANEFVSSHISLESILFISIFLFFLAYLSKLLNKLKIKNINIYLLIFLIFSNIFLIYKTNDNTISNLVSNYIQYEKNYTEFIQNKNNRINKLISNIDTSNINYGVYVLVIGESQNKKHMSLYGYNRNTTPNLDKLQNSKNFIKFNNAYSSNVYTLATITYALTEKNQYNNISFKDNTTLIEILNTAGFNTVWLSNQGQSGLHDTAITLIGREANQQDWINKLNGKEIISNHYDLDLLKSLDKIQLTNNMFIVIHLLGNHGDYNKRYPDSFNIYINNTNIDTYDNSIYYNDYVMNSIIEKVKNIPNFKALIYFSDHGEDISLGHDINTFTPDMTYIPMYIYLSDDYISSNLLKYNYLIKAKDYYITNDLIFNTVLGIININIPFIYEPENDITNNNYDNNIYKFKTLSGKKLLTEYIYQ